MFDEADQRWGVDVLVHNALIPFDVTSRRSELGAARPQAGQKAGGLCRRLIVVTITRMNQEFVRSAKRSSHSAINVRSAGVSAPSALPRNASRNATARPGRSEGVDRCAPSCVMIPAIAVCQAIPDSWGSRS
jgi:hypothetical protein